MINHSINTACKIAGISRAMLYKLIKLKQGPRVTKIGRRSFISSVALESWLKNLEQQSPGEKHVDA
jgi:predicted DNA-binding transcriptional regulator AlpA